MTLNLKKIINKNQNEDKNYVTDYTIKGLCTLTSIRLQYHTVQSLFIDEDTKRIVYHVTEILR